MVALAVGLSNQSAFGAAFKRETGCTPAAGGAHGCHEGPNAACGDWPGWERFRLEKRVNWALISRPPGRALRPSAQSLLSPFNRFVSVAERAGVWNIHASRSSQGRDETKCMGADLHVGDCLFDFRHVTGDAFASGTVQLCDACGPRCAAHAGRSASLARGSPGILHSLACVASRRSRCHADRGSVKQVTPRVYIRLCTKSLPCIRFLCAVPSGKCVNVSSPSLCSSSFQ